jgi:hypothetical protein
MKPSSLIPGLAPLFVALVAGCAVSTSDAVKTPPRTVVTFDHPENFTDVKDASVPTDRGRDAILSRIREFLVSRADPLLPEGYKLSITFTDIDLAGKFEPWHSAIMSDEVRFIRPIYPPAFKFTYSVSDASGRVVKSGTENIKDLNFQMRLIDPTATATDSLAYEKDILGEWARTTLRDLKKA